MSMQDRLFSLKGKHAALDAELLTEQQRPMPNHAHCSKLKREKLRLKDQILQLQEAATVYEGSDAIH